MIHQFIFAAPKPGMNAQEFQDYWVNNHAVNYAAKIPQIVRYLIDTRIPFEGDMGTPQLPHEGIAEIWLRSGEEQLASLQTPEFLEGARLDEPNWAAFWFTIVVDTQAHEVIAGPGMVEEADWVKMTVLLKRKEGMSLEAYREQSLGSYAETVSQLPGLRRYLHCHTQDGAYTFGEANFDSVEQYFFDDVDALKAAFASQAYEQVKSARAALVNPKYVFSMTAKEHWVIGPALREPSYTDSN
jgi:hypothetical protein